MIAQPMVKKLLSQTSIGDECWLWTGNKASTGYGTVIADCQKEYAHRVSYLSLVGDIPEGLYVLHRCDTPLCVNPKHLFLGTHMDNMKDKIAKGRVPSGNSHWNWRPRRYSRAYLKRLEQASFLHTKSNH